MDIFLHFKFITWPSRTDSSASWEIPSLTRYPNIRCPVDKVPLLISILESNKFSPHPSLPFLSSILILSFLMCAGFPNGLYPSCFPINIFTRFLRVYYIRRPSHPLRRYYVSNIWRRVQFVKLSLRVSLPPPPPTSTRFSYLQIFFSAPCFQTHWNSVFPLIWETMFHAYTK